MFHAYIVGTLIACLINVARLLMNYYLNSYIFIARYDRGDSKRGRTGNLIEGIRKGNQNENGVDGQEACSE